MRRYRLYRVLLVARTVIPTNQFKRDIKKRFVELITPQWIEVMNCLINNLQIPEKYRNHPLQGEWKGCMDCHIKPDLVLIYEFKNNDEIILHRLGSHSELSIG